MRLVTVFAWIMILGGLSFGFLFLARAVFPPHAKPGSATTEAGYRAIFLVAAYLSAAAAVLGAGLKTRLAWSWYGTVGFSLVFVYLGLLLPISIANAGHPTPAGVLGGITLGVAVFLPALLSVWQLFRPDVKKGFGILASPPLWIRVIAVAYLTESGLIFLGVLNPKPRALFGVLKNRELLFAYAILSGFLWIWIGRGLYRYQESARRWAIGISLFSVADYTCFNVIDPATPSQIFVRGFSLFLVTTVAFLTVWYLHTRRRWFGVLTRETPD